ncbi:hypothetical protein [Streptomyces daghestanicus]|uniref:Integral membrane protein n=1 Tax=Streptomyces daghestanicus TaxID=66885 RepID=A0ABQ3Q2V8_9ACTN|nr:hypothetical protein [Streptomyces daghestanicus]GGU20647.1 hypothetical protein GCM10010259_08630 [Streptomyces daghestanicus]GHI31581.1 hypothetical protein Sdagh_33110 [Streptomyces daghestanicus]
MTTHRDPPVPGITAPHIPADDYRRAEATGAPVVIVVHADGRTGRPAREYLFPLAIAGAGILGVFGLIAAFLALLDFAVHTALTIGGAAGPIGIGGITLRLFRNTH